jgi:hypothetical protein
MLPGADRREAAAVLGLEGEIHGRHPEREEVRVRGGRDAREASEATIT